jgi:hypothetical protein
MRMESYGLLGCCNSIFLLHDHHNQDGDSSTFDVFAGLSFPNVIDPHFTDLYFLELDMVANALSCQIRSIMASFFLS